VRAPPSASGCDGPLVYWNLPVRSTVLDAVARDQRTVGAERRLAVVAGGLKTGSLGEPGRLRPAVAQVEPAQVGHVVPGGGACHGRHDLAQCGALPIGARDPGDRVVAGLGDPDRDPPTEPAERHQMVADEREHLPRRLRDRDRTARDQFRVEVDADEPQRSPKGAPTPAQGSEHSRVDRRIEPIRVREAQPQLGVAAAERLAMGGEDPVDQRRLRPREGAVGRVRRAAQVDLVGDRQRNHVGIGAERVDHMTHEPGPVGQLAGLCRARVVADLNLGIEAGAVVALDKPPEATDAGGAV
jgi:hypothetical protein